LAIAASPPPLARAQGGGQLDERTEYQVIQGPGVGTNHGPLLAIVLWRGETGWLGGSEPQRRSADSIYRFVRRDAENRGLLFFGSGYAYGLLSEDGRQLIVESRPFDIARTDSALVVMVAVPAFGLPRIVTTSRISADAVPEAFWTKMWHSGDTTFMVHPQHTRLVEMLKRALDTSPAARAFLR
jgi:hypothetical protein